MHVTIGIRRRREKNGYEREHTCTDFPPTTQMQHQPEDYSSLFVHLGRLLHTTLPVDTQK